MKKLVKLSLVSLLVLTSCSDVMIEDHIEGSWKLVTYLRNDVDETSELTIADYEETYMLDGTFSRSYISGKQISVEESGEFSIDEDNSQIMISGVSSIADFSERNSTISTSTVDIVVIDEGEYAYSFENGGDVHEFWFIRQE